jgi:hypothetical protein
MFLFTNSSLPDMPRGTTAGNSLTPVESERLFETACIEEISPQSRHEDLSVQLAFSVFFLEYLGFRFEALLDFDEGNVMRDADGTIVGIRVPHHGGCNHRDGNENCVYCKKLAAAMARNADDEEVTAEDFYCSSKSTAGYREVPVISDRGQEIVEQFLESQDNVDMSEETVCRRLTRLAGLTENIESDQMMSQALRASTANYWTNFKGPDVRHLQDMMGWGSSVFS